jgi:hypothetical protein
MSMVSRWSVADFHCVELQTRALPQETTLLFLLPVNQDIVTFKLNEKLFCGPFSFAGDCACHSPE